MMAHYDNADMSTQQRSHQQSDRVRGASCLRVQGKASKVCVCVCVVRGENKHEKAQV